MSCPLIKFRTVTYIPSAPGASPVTGGQNYMENLLTPIYTLWYHGRLHIRRI
jgi:hypothetical protein